MPSEKGGKFMEIFNANIERGENSKLILNVKGVNYEILLTEDKPNEVKNVFNKLLEELKNGEFNFKLENDSKEDLYYLISMEYLQQLNSELTSIYREMVDYKLVNVVKPLPLSELE